MELLKEIDKYKELLDLKDSLDEQTKANNKAIEEAKQRMKNAPVSAGAASNTSCRRKSATARNQRKHFWNWSSRRELRSSECCVTRDLGI